MLRQAPEARKAAGAEAKRYKMGSFSSTSPSPAHSTSTIHRSSIPSGDDSSTNMTGSSLDHDMDAGGGGAHSNESPNGLRVIADESKRLTQLVTRIRELGVEETGLALPKLCVVGGQSTGKSSLIEAISEIRVPRADDTCTRCPLEINLSGSQSSESCWVCRVSLVRAYYYDNTRGRSKRNPFGPWTSQSVRDTVAFETLHDKAEVEDVLRRAQLATLNPSQDPSIFKRGGTYDPDNAKTVTFSPNVIRLDISGPGLPNLCFYDLPGVIEQGEHDGDVDLVKHLVKEYIRDPTCVVLDTLPMNADIQNASSGALIDEMKAGHRTIGVLTKPDCMTRGQNSFKQWADVLEGRRFRRKWGYFVVMNSQDISINHIDAREKETDFFRNQEPFNQQLNHHKHRFGVPALKDFLSTVLVDLIRESLSPLTEKIKEKIAGTSQQLESLPKPLQGNVSLQVDAKMKLFSKGLEQEIEGGSRDHPLFSQWYDRATKFSDLIVASYPSLKFPMNLTQADRHGTPRRRNDLAGASSPIRQTVEITISDDEEKAAAQPANKKRKINTIPRPFFQSREPPVPRSQEATPLITGWEIDKLRDLTRSLNKGLPGARDIEVTSTIFKDSISHWRELLLGFLREVKDQIGNMIDEHVAKVFSQWDNTEMYELISRIVSVFCQSVFEKQLAVSEDYLRMEIATVLTFDFQAKERYERDDKAYLHEKSREWVFKGEVRRKQLWSPDQPISLAVQNQIKDEVEKSPPPFESEIDEMTAARSYYNIAARRFTDNIGLSTRTGVFTQIQKGLRTRLAEEIGLDQDDANARCRNLLEPDREVVKQRETLTKHLKALEDSLEELKQESVQTALAQRSRHAVN